VACDVSLCSASDLNLARLGTPKLPSRRALPPSPEKFTSKRFFFFFPHAFSDARGFTLHSTPSVTMATMARSVLAVAVAVLALSACAHALPQPKRWVKESPSYFSFLLLLYPTFINSQNFKK
jgi:hypothetical protein